jgi:hypothetical protein
MLGIRPSVDIIAEDDDIVKPGRGGLSVTPDDLAKLPLHVRPASLGGKGKLPVFAIAAPSLSERLVYRPDPQRPDRHGFIEPAAPMRLPDYQTALSTTRGAWKEVA